ncbi:MAG: hypothetical protein WBQ77_08915, partial [Methyloceanibacter sp.]|uniref:hypothetical protein n=1 Tax=Methyloceanibacter sp. TaxID=1965321 RepID=UPI003C3CC1C1
EYDDLGQSDDREVIILKSANDKSYLEYDDDEITNRYRQELREINQCVNFRENVGQCSGVRVGHWWCRCSKPEGPARGAFWLSRVVHEAMRSGAPLTV